MKRALAAMRAELARPATIAHVTLIVVLTQLLHLVTNYH